MVINYVVYRAAVDGALHLFVEDTKTNKAGEEEPYRRATYSRVWFQLKGKRADTVTAEQFQKATMMSVEVEIDHLKFWYGSPETVYLVVYVESVNTFLALV